MRIIEDIQRRIYTRTSFEFAMKIPRFRLENIFADYPPELINRFFDILNIEKGLPKIIIDLSVSVISIFLGLILLSFYHPIFVSFGVILTVVLYVLLRYSGEEGYQNKLKVSSWKYKTAHWLQELARSMVTFKMIPASDFTIKKTDKIVSEYLDARKKYFNVLILQYIAIIGFKTIIITGLLIIGAYLVVTRKLNIGQFVAAEIIIFIVLSAVEKLIFSISAVYDVLVGMEKISQVLSTQLENEQGVDFDSLASEKGVSISIRDLCYSLHSDGKLALKHLNLEIAQGEKICVVGRNGSGKSTFVHLLSGIYYNYTGTIIINGVPAHNYNLPSIRNHIGCCFYPEDVFAGTIAENITFGEKDKLTEMKSVSDKIGLSPFVQSLKNGYNTMLTPESRRFPKSIIKKIILARNVLKKPKLLILDDLLMQIATNKRAKIIDYLVSEENSCTLVLVANDPYIISQCNRVVIMEDGTITDTIPSADALQHPIVKDILNL
jgi:ABC-type bacteriocin/lantibiotic exporter with double-glycine peptidase domain